MRVRALFLHTIWITMVLFGAVGSWAADATVQQFSPQGNVKGVRQAAVRFSDQMVSFGSPEIANPFDISCAAPGKGRWADGKNWVYDFDHDLKAGLRCKFTLKAGVKTLKGKELKGRKAFTFSTGGPAVTDIYPNEGMENIEEDQVMILALDGAATEDSVTRHASFYVEETKEHLGIRVIKGADREKVLKALKDIYWVGAEKKSADMVIVQCKRPFPSEATVQFRWGKGIVSPSGIATTKDQVFSFKTRPPFSAKFRCIKEKANADCVGLLPVALRFSSPIPKKVAEKIILKGKEKTYAPSFDENDRETVENVEFKGPFPEKSSFVLTLPKGLKDDSGRSLSNASSFPLTVKTGAYPPLAKFASRFGIIEKADPVLPVTVRSIGAMLQGKSMDVSEDGSPAPKKQEAAPAPPAKEGQISERVTATMHQVNSDKDVITWLRKVSEVGRARSIFVKETGLQSFSVPKPGADRATEVVGIPLKKPGLYIVELKSEILGSALIGAKKPMYVPTSALVTNLSAHFKWGKESSLVWVTTLNKAEPVPDSSVAIRDCSGKAVWEGKTDKNGIAYIGKALPPRDKLAHCDSKPDEDAFYDSEQMRALSSMGSGLFVFAKTEGDMTFVHSSWEDGIEPYRFKLPMDESPTSVAAHTIFDRTLLRAGETVHMKHIIRKTNMKGLSLVARDLPDHVRIEHLGRGEKYEMPLKWDVKTGAAETSWPIPKTAKLGHYSVSLVTGEKAKRSGGTYYSGEFRVEEFRVPLMKATVQPVSQPLVNVRETEMNIFAEYLSGGGAINLPVRLRSKVQPRYVTFEDYPGFSIANGAVKEGIERRGGGEMDMGEEGEESPEIARPRGQGKNLPTLDLVLGAGGMARAKIKDIPAAPTPQDLVAELEFKDPNGEIQTVSTRVPVYGASILTGVEAEAGGELGMAKVKILALDLSGKPLPGTAIKANLFSEVYYTHRTRLVGGFYSYQTVREVKRIKEVCEGKADKDGMVQCEVKSPVSGTVIIEAKAADGKGNVSSAFETVWLPGKTEWWFDQGASDRIDLIPDKKRYEPGETASFQVRMPMREATVLFTIEREGVLEARVERITGKNPTITLPIKGSYAPNVFVSALCLRGRAGEPKPTAMVDLGRPSYKLGIASISVGWAAHELKVTVTPEKKVYRIRDKAEVKIKVAPVSGKALPKNAEVAIAAVDEGLLELMPNKSWNLLEKMMQKRGYSVHTSTAQMHVVGKRHYGLKAMPAGGGGGRQPTRELFDTLIYWKAVVPLDDRGEATVTVPLNDSLTSFAIVAVATAGENLFGTGQGRIQTSQDLILTSGLPHMVRQGDRFRAGFLVRNTTKSSVKAQISAVCDNSKEKKTLPAITEEIGAGEAKEVGWDVTVPMDGDTLKWEVSAKGKGDASDRMKVTQRIAPYAAVQVVQATLTQVVKPYSLKVEAPKDAIPGKGGLKVSLSPRLSDNASGIIDYMNRYPYGCLEQQVSKAVALEDKAMWANIVAKMPSYQDNEGLFRYFPGTYPGSDVLTSYIMAVADEADWTIPPAIASKMEEGLRNFVQGKLQRRQPLPTADLTLRKLAAIEALSRRGKADKGLLDSLSIDPNLWPTSAVIDWAGILTRVRSVPERDKKLRAAGQILRSRLNFQGTTMGFSTEKSDFLWWLMTDADVNSVRMVLAFLGNQEWRADMPGIMRGAIGRQKAGHWNTTVANAWGRLTLKKFGKAFEAEPVTGTTTATIAKDKKSLLWDEHKTGGTLSFGWPKGPETLAVSHAGTGKPWATISSLAAIPRKTAFSSGYAIKKTVTPVDRKSLDKWSVGDVVRVRLEGDAQSDMTWVALADPIPAGATILGSGLGRDSEILTSGERQKGWVRPVFEERSFEAFTAYYEYMPKGKWYIEYTMRLNNQGTFRMPSTRMEALYAPEMFGELPNGSFEVK